MANLATKAGVEGKSRIKIHTPLIHMTKAEIIRRASTLGVDYGLTWSCYDPQAGERACGRCDSCQLRLKGLRRPDSKDPITYALPDVQRLMLPEPFTPQFLSQLETSRLRTRKEFLGSQTGQLRFTAARHQPGIRRLSPR